jgi:3-phosphoinositide dependent protein kinase-1
LPSHLTPSYPLCRHLKITDFGTSKILEEAPEGMEKRNSFVGTAEYVSPEVLNDEEAGRPADMWALGCIIYQMLVGQPPFRGESEYLTFQKILARDLSYPAHLPESARDLIDKLLCLEPSDRLGGTPDGYKRLKRLPFFSSVEWETIHSTEPPVVLEPDELPPPEVLSTSSEGDLDDEDDEGVLEDAGVEEVPPAPSSPELGAGSQWNQFLEVGETIVYCGLVTKHRRPFTKRRQLILTTTPRLVYIDHQKMVVKGEIAWGRSLWAELRDTRTFYIHTPNRSYYMQGVSSGAKCWVDCITQMQKSISDRTKR